MSWQRSTPKAAVDNKANDNSMQEKEFGKTNPFSDQSAAPGAKRKMIALNALCVTFSGYDSTLGDMLLICVIGICINCVDMKRRKQNSQFV